MKGPTEAQHAALREVRSFIDSEAGRQLYARRAGIERTLSQGVRSFGLRRARYRGEAKAHLQHVVTMCGAELQPGLRLAGRRVAHGDAGLAVSGWRLERNSPAVSGPSRENPDPGPGLIAELARSAGAF